MKAVIVLCLLGVALAAPPVKFQAGVEVPIVSHDVFIEPDGSKFRYSYETGDGVKAEQQSEVVGSVRGSFSFPALDGQFYTVTYTADENGYHPEGAHLPVAPPVPDYIVRALRYIAEHPYVEKH